MPQFSISQSFNYLVPAHCTVHTFSTQEIIVCVHNIVFYKTSQIAFKQRIDLFLELIFSNFLIMNISVFGVKLPVK